MKIAIVGTGISGMVAAYLLHRDHEITVFEAADYIGGHTNTVDVPMEVRSYAIDTGFIVFNDWTYPNFIALWMATHPVEDLQSADGKPLRCKSCHGGNPGTPEFPKKIILTDRLPSKRAGAADADAGASAPDAAGAGID